MVSTKQKCLVSLLELFVEMPAYTLFFFFFFCIQLFWDELCHLKPIRLIDSVCVMVNGSVGLVPLFINSVFNLAERFTHLFIFHPGCWLRFIVAGGTIWLNYPKATGSSPVFLFLNIKKQHWLRVLEWAERKRADTQSCKKQQILRIPSLSGWMSCGSRGILGVFD